MSTVPCGDGSNVDCMLSDVRAVNAGNVCPASASTSKTAAFLSSARGCSPGRSCLTQAMVHALAVSPTAGDRGLLKPLRLGSALSSARTESLALPWAAPADARVSTGGPWRKQGAMCDGASFPRNRTIVSSLLSTSDGIGDFMDIRAESL